MFENGHSLVSSKYNACAIRKPRWVYPWLRERRERESWRGRVKDTRDASVEASTQLETTGRATKQVTYAHMALIQGESASGGARFYGVSWGRG